MKPPFAGVLLATFLSAAAARSAAAEPFSADAALERDRLLTEAAAVRLHEDRLWRLLLHLPGDATVSLADAPAFFLASDGKGDAAAELRATIAAFFEAPGAPDEHALCRFPARLRFVAERLALDASKLPSPACPEYEKWRGVVSAGSATLVFASAQVEVPASMYGHTFLKLDRPGAPAGTTLLSTIVNYAATPDSFNPFTYVVKGLGGGFPGRFQAMPYFVKVAEYTNHESRELWEYPLKLDASALDRLLRHLWELDSTHFDYYFLSENCSYHLLALLDVAAPDARMSERFGAWTIPVDTVRAAQAAGIAGEGVLRPSHLSLLRARRDTLEPGERDLVERLADAWREPSWEPLLALPPARQALVLDTAFDHLKFRHGFSGAMPEPVKRRERRLLQERSTLRVPSRAPAIPRRASPESGHLSTRAGLGVRVSGSAEEPHVSQEISWRPALHDLLDAPDGYSDGTRLEMFTLTVRVDPALAGSRDRGADALSLERAELVHVDTLRPWERWVRGVSWRAAFGAGRSVDAGCAGWDCTQVDGHLAVGAAAGTPRAMVWLRGGAIPALFGPWEEDWWRVTGELSTGTLLQLGRRSRIHAEASLRHDAWGGTVGEREPYPALSFGQSVDLGRSAQLRLRLTRVRDTREAVLTAFTYF